MTGPWVLTDVAHSAKLAERQALLSQFLLKYRLRATNTYHPRFVNAEVDALPSPCTRIHWTKRTQISQLDYLLSSLCLQGALLNWGVLNELAEPVFHSDHEPVWNHYSFDAAAWNTSTCSSSQVIGRKLNLGGWKAQNIIQFQQKLAARLNLQGHFQHDRAVFAHAKIDEVRKIIERVSLSVDFTTKRAAWIDLQRKPDSVLLAQAASKAATTLEEKRRCRKEEKSQLRWWRGSLAMAQTRNSGVRAPVMALEIGGEKTSDKGVWANAILQHCQDKYTDKTSLPTNRQLVDYLDSCKPESFDASKPTLQVRHIFKAISKLARDSSAGGGEVLSTSVLQMMPIIVWYELVHLFSRRFKCQVLNQLTENIASWKLIIMVFLKKVSDACNLSDFRGIALLAVLRKVYVASLVIALQENISTFVTASVCSFGFLEGHSVEIVIIVISILFRKHWEWRCLGGVHGPQTDTAAARLFMLVADVQSAFDACHQFHAATSFLAAEAPWDVIKAMAQESSDMRLKPSFDQIDSAEMDEVAFDKLPQGGTESPKSFWQTVAMTIAEIIPIWRAQGAGIQVNNFLLTHIIWADNVFLFAKEYGMLRLMSVQLTDALALKGLYWKASSLAWMCIDAHFVAPNFQLQMQQGDGEVKRCESIETLGALLTSDGSSVSAVRHRLHKANACFWSHRYYFESHNVTPAQKVNKFEQKVVPVALFGATSWTILRSTFSSPHRFEKICIRHMFYHRRHDAEEWPAYITRWTRSAWAIYKKFSGVSILVHFFNRLYKFGKRFSDFKSESPAYFLLYNVIEWRNVQWWEQVQNLSTLSSKTLWRGAWRHGTKGRRPVQWESVFVYVYGSDWLQFWRASQWPVGVAPGGLNQKLYFALECLRFGGFGQFKTFFSAHDAGQIEKSLRNQSGRDATVESDGFVCSKRRKRAHNVSFPLEIVTAATNFPCCKLFGDNDSLVQQLNLKAQTPVHSARIYDAHISVAWLWKQGHLRLQTPEANWFQHIPRSFNERSDSLANKAMDDQNSFLCIYPCVLQKGPPLGFRGLWDGGFRSGPLGYRDSSGLSGCGWVIQVALGTPEEHKWWDLAEGSVFMNVFGVQSSFESELCGLEFLVATFHMAMHSKRSVAHRSYLNHLQHHSQD